MRRIWKFVILFLAIAIAGGTTLLLVMHRYSMRQITLEGAVLVRNDDVDKQVPINRVEVSTGEGLERRATWSGPTGFFGLTMAVDRRRKNPLILHFRHPNFLPLDLAIPLGNRLCVAQMTPVEEPVAANAPPATVQVANVVVKYSINTTSLVNAGSIVKTFRVINVGNVPCNGHNPCSPDGKWKAAIGTATLDAPRGNVFLNARVACIAGPCPFTRINSDGFSRGGPTLHVAVLDWSDTTVFLFEAEVFRSMSTGSTRSSYPVIFGRTMHFTVPGGAEGVYIEADVGSDSIVFPLGPEPSILWASCTERVTADQARAYQCEMKPGYKFKN
jgi:hypothetical protein